MTRVFAVASLCVLFLPACAVAPPRDDVHAAATRSSPARVPSSTVEPIGNLKEVEDHASRLPREKTLVVFDIDDTLLTTPLDATGQRVFFGSDRWYLWQAYGLPKGNPEKIGNCLFEVIGVNAREAKQDQTQGDAMEILARIPNDRLILTSRSPDMRAATEAQLASVGYKGIPSLASGPTPLEIMVDGKTGTYDNGIFLTQGVNKGHALVELLKTVQRNYDYVILADDTEKHVLNMGIAMALQGTGFVGLRYTNIKNDPPLEVTREQVEAHRRDWKQPLARHPEQAPRWKAGQCP